MVHTTAQIAIKSPSDALADKRILVTGGSKGIGYAMAKKFVDEGATVMITGRNEEVLKKSAQNIGCQYWCMDVSNTAFVRNQYAEADKKMGGFNCLVNDAGISLHEKSFLDVTVEQFDAQFSTNLRGAYFLTQLFCQKVKDEKRGTVR